MNPKLLAALLLMLVFSIGNAAGQAFLHKFTTVGAMTELGKETIFVADDGITGMELWKTDGTPEGTILIRDIVPGRNGSSPANLFTYKQEVFFAAYDPIRGTELWKSDGTEAGTVLVKDMAPNINIYAFSSFPRAFALLNGAVYFATTKNNNSNQLWKTDGSEAGTVLVMDLPMSVGQLIPIQNTLFIVPGNWDNRFFKSDGTKAGTQVIHMGLNNLVAGFQAFNQQLYFITHDGNRTKIQLHKTSPSLDAPVLLKDFTPNVQYATLEIGNFTSLKGDIFFSVRTQSLSAPPQDVLWKTDGTPAGTVAVTTFSWTPSQSQSYTQGFTAFQDKLYFSGPSSENHCLKVTDGTAAGIAKVHPVSVYASTRPVVVGEHFYFIGNGDLWRSDGTETGTRLYADLNMEKDAELGNFYAMQQTLYFKAKDDQGLGLWTIQAVPEITISTPYPMLHQGGLTLNATVDSLVTRNLEIANTGNQDMVISQVQVSGHPFYVSGTITAPIPPGKKRSLQLHYLPLREGEVRGSVVIRSNDTNESTFVISLIGLATGKARTPFARAAGLELNKELLAADPSARIKLEPAVIGENAPAGTLVGQLAVPLADNRPYTFSLAAGPGSNDNPSFTIHNNQILAGRRFDQETRNTYSIRVKAVSSADTLLQTLTVWVQDQAEPPTFASCQSLVQSLDYGLADVAFADENNVIAIGQGVILKSENAGKDWREINSGTFGLLQHIQFVDHQTGYIVASANVILKTEDGGNSWFPLEFPDKDFYYSSINNLHFISAQVGFVFGGNGRIYKTADGGRNWHRLGNGFNDLASGYFVNEQLGFVCGRSATLAKTTDGGITWQRINMDAFGWNLYLSDIQFLSETTGFVLGRNGQVLKTTDGGSTWAKVGQAGYFENAQRLFFRNEREGYVTNSGSYPYLLKTEDGGVTWRGQPNPGYGPLGGFALSPSGNKACVVGLGNSLGWAGHPGRAIAISTSPNHWERISQLEPADFLGIKMLNKNTGLLLGTRSYRTADGGITWHHIPDLAGDVRYYRFLNESTGFVFTAADIYKTSDAGLTWTQVDAANTLVNSAHFIHWVDANNLFIIDDGGAVFHSADGGLTWAMKKYRDPVFNDFYNLYFHNKDIGFRAATAGIFKTTDGGLTWKLHYKPGSGKFPHSVYLLNATTGWAGGTDGLVLKTTDGGNTWTEIPTSIGLITRFFDFIDENNGFVVASDYDGGQSRIYATTDGGLTWREFITVGENIREMSRLGNVLYWAGKRGLVQKIAGRRPPGIPGYIRGEMPVSESGREHYSVPESFGTYYTWSVDGDHDLTYQGNQATIHWKQPGTYTIRVSPYNSCFTGEARELQVEVQPFPNPQITGPNPVKAFSRKQVYTTPAKDNHQYNWALSGQSSFTPAGNEVRVNWGLAGTGTVEVLALNRQTGASKKARLDIEIQPEEEGGLQAGKELKGLEVYPNPTPGEVLIRLDNQSEQDVEVTLLNTAGVRLLSRSFPKKGLGFAGSIHLDSFSGGLYILKISQGDKQMIYKIVKPF